MMTFDDAPNVNALWARLVMAEFVRAGARHVVVCPGSRSTPLALAAHASDLEVVVALDERGAAFHALGIAKATGCAAPVITTSGTAVANLLPAAVEAWASGIPMLLLTADRPPELLACGANQAIPQRDVLGGFARWSVDLGCPTDAVDARVVLSTAAEAWNRAHTVPCGAVQMNCPFREPLGLQDAPWNRATLESIRAWIGSKAPWRAEACFGGGPGLLAALRAVTRGSSRGVIVAGALRDEAERDAVLILAARLGWPVVADITSGLRGVPTALARVIAHGDLVLRSEAAQRALVPDGVLRVGGAITSKAVAQWIDASRVRPVLVGRHAQRQDPSHTAAFSLDVDLAALARDLVNSQPEALPAVPSALTDSFVQADLAAAAAIEAWMESTDDLSEPWIAWWLAQHTPAGVLLAGNSMPVRDLDMHAPVRRDLVVLGQRGASGIDGLIATASGIARSGAPTTALIGDVSALHDLSSLELLRRTPGRCTLAIVNNDGGGIFHFLPVAQQPVPFETLFGTPHGCTFEGAASMFGLPYARATTRGDAVQALQRAWSQPVPAIVELITPRSENLARHRALQACVAKAIDDALAG
ncbi:MAG: 2-succinyl-5-enolpyruvyl-6-hydroxy-3-cyclohexene-1-carboxylic-acid synthase [Planctomycetes bacterium]|nr:2-succinyl-5-enolpyruvyl-6-hydroxy-3-cyclohexene-1-carboxylic-acid synthase [Planctomycetota bacterium]